MRPTPLRRALPAASAGAAALLASLLALQLGGALFVNFGPGDAPFARGFRSAWERDGLRGGGETTFRWTEDGARLDLPFVVRGGQLEARARIARFADGEAGITVVVGGAAVDRWIQPPRGWGERRIALGAIRGPLRLQFRSEASGDDPLGVAVDWIEIAGAGTLAPAGSSWPGLLALFVGVPSLLALSGAASGLAIGLVLAVVAPSLVIADRFGGFMALCAAGGPALLASFGLVLLGRALGRRWPKGAVGSSLPPAAVAAVLALLFLSHPFFFYPDVDTHARFVDALRDEPALGLDPTPFQQRTGAWTRTLGGSKVAFPYSPAFHLAAVPLAWAFGPVAAVKTLAALGVGLSLLVVGAFGAALGLPGRFTLVAQAVFALLPVTSSRLTLALYPTLAAQALELLLAGHLAFAYFRGSTSALGTAAVLLAVQAAYTGSLINVALIVLFVAGAAALAGRRVDALRLLGAWAATAGVVALALYARFLPALLRDVLPHALAPSADADAGVDPVALVAISRRALFFYGPWLPLLAALGIAATRGAPFAAAHVLRSVVAAGATLLLLRGLLPGLLRDAKEVELLAAPVALFTAAGLAALAKRGRAGRIGAAVASIGLLGWGALRAAGAYGERFFAVGR